MGVNLSTTFVSNAEVAGTWCVWDKQQLLNLHVHRSLDGNWHDEGIMWDSATVLATDLTKKTDILQRLVGGPRIGATTMGTGGTGPPNF